MADFDEAVSDWGRVAPQLNFLGEIALSKSETDHHLKTLRSRLETHYYYATYTVPITVLAINCAYYYYDDNGFWKHFCTHLHIANNWPTQSNFGNIIERYLQKLAGNRFDERSGPFRYVGRILEQCGVSQHYMKKFVDFIKFIKGHSSWDAVSKLSHDEYNKCIPDGLPKFLHKFLKDISGWYFVIAVANNMSQYERKLIDDAMLCTLSGYRPEFWIDFLKFYNGTAIKLSAHQPSARSFGYVEPPYLYWPDKKPPRNPDFVADGEHVYMKPFGRIGIGNFNSLSVGRYIFVSCIAGKTNLISTDKLQKDTEKFGSLDLNKLGVSTPCELELWFEATGRTSGQGQEKQLGKWICTLVDAISFEVSPQQLLPPEDSLSIAIRGPQNYQLSFPQPAKNKSHGKEWAVPCSSSYVDGAIVAGSLAIPISIPVYRDMLRMESGSKILLNSHEDLTEHITIEGWPGSKVELVIQDNIRKQTVETGIRFGGDGNVRLSVKNNLEKALKSWPGSWGLISQGTGTLEGCILYLNLPAFMQDAAELWNYPDIFFNALPRMCSSAFKQLASMTTSQCRHSFDASLVANFPEKLQKIAWILAACAKVFDGTNILNLEVQDKRIPYNTRKTLLWYLKARDIHSDDKPDDLDFLIDSLGEPEAVYAPRWIGMVQSERQRILELSKLRTDLGQQITEWVSEVTGVTRLTYSGVIANLTGGQELTKAWKGFYENKQSLDRLQVIYSLANALVNVQGTVGALARILQLVVLKNSGRKHLMQKIDTANMSIELDLVAKYLRGNTDSTPPTLFDELLK